MSASSISPPRSWSVVIAAAGDGTRMAADRRKPHLELAGRPILHRAIECFSTLEPCRGIVVVLHPDDLAGGEAAEELAARCGPCTVVAGGTCRQESVLNGLEALDPDGPDVVLIHDAVRPLVRADVILRVAAEAARQGAAIAAVPAGETVKRAGADRTVVETPDRSALWFARTPQGFRRGIILEAHRRAAREGFTGTDDAQLVERIGGTVALVEDDYSNIKITAPADLLAVKGILAGRDRTAER